MLGQSVRLLVAIFTFTIGITIVRVLQLVPNLESTLVNRFFIVNNSDLSPASAVIFDSAEDANEIYRLLVHQKFRFDDEVKLIVLQFETTGCLMYEGEYSKKRWGYSETFHQMMKELMPEAELQTLDNYLANNKTPEPLKVSNLGINYVIVKDSDLPDVKFDRFWAKFYKKYPNSSGIIFFSNVGFNDQHDQAFVYAGRSCGGLCGEGEYVLLNKVNGKWEIRQERGLWVS